MCVRDEDLHADTDQRDLVLLNKLIDTSKKKRTVFFTKYTHQRKKIRLQLVNITAQMGVPNMFASCQHVTSMILYMDVFSCRVMLLAGAV